MSNDIITQIKEIDKGILELFKNRKKLLTQLSHIKPNCFLV